jgi:hypothetical protein
VPYVALTTSDIRAISQVPFDQLGFVIPADGTTADPLMVLLRRATGYVQQVTGQTLDTSLSEDLATTAEEAVQMRVEQLAYAAQDDTVSTGAVFEQTNNFTAGSYSETSRDMNAQRAAHLVNPWPALHDRLWRMMNQDKRDEWLMYWNGTYAPALMVQPIYGSENFSASLDPSTGGVNSGLNISGLEY